MAAARGGHGDGVCGTCRRRLGLPRGSGAQQVCRLSSSATATRFRGRAPQTFTDFTDLGGAPTRRFLSGRRGTWGHHDKFLGVYRFRRSPPFEERTRAATSSHPADQGLGGPAGNLERVVDVSDRIPGGHGTTSRFKVLCCPHGEADGDVIFSGANSYGGTLPVGVGIEGIYRWSASSGAVTHRRHSDVRARAHLPWQRIVAEATCCFSRMCRGHHAASERRQAAAPSAQPAASASEPPLRLVGVGTRVPAADQPSHSDSVDRGFFRAFGSPVSGGGCFGAFIGSSTTGFVGVYLLDLVGRLAPPVFNVVRAIADTATLVPGSPPSANDVFAEFPMDPSVSGSHVVFFARASNQSNTGLYLWGPSTEYAPRAVVTLGSSGLFDLTAKPNSFAGTCLTYFGSDGRGNSSLFAVNPFEAAGVAFEQEQGTR